MQRTKVTSESLFSVTVKRDLKDSEVSDDTVIPTQRS
jgi:hypothetical protein